MFARCKCPGPPLAGLLLAALLIALPLCQAGAAGAFFPKPVPKVVGMPLSQAKSLLSKAGFKVEAVATDTIYPDRHLKVKRQSPLPGGMVSGDPPTVTIWYQDLKFHDRQLEAKLKAPTAPASPLEPPPGLTAEPSQPAGPQQAAPQAETVVVPTLIGLPLGLASQLAEQSGLELNLEGTLSTPLEGLDKMVATQSPEPGTSLDKGETINLRLYSFEGKTTLEQARELLLNQHPLLSPPQKPSLEEDKQTPGEEGGKEENPAEQ